MDYEVEYLLCNYPEYKMYKGVSKLTREGVLIKEYKDTVTDQRIEREREMLGLFKDSPHVVKKIAYFTMGKVRMLVLEECSFTLHNLLSSKMFKNKEVVDIGFKIFTGLQELANNDIYLRNLRPDNIWISLNSDNECQFKFGDFLESIEAGPKHKSKIYPSDEYNAPEITTIGPYFVNKADIYSLGNIMYALVFRLSSKAKFGDTYIEEQTQEELNNLHKGLRDILEGCTQKEPLHRFNMFGLSEAFKAFYRYDVR